MTLTLRRLRLRWPMFYAALLVASALSQRLLWPGFGAPRAGDSQHIIQITGHDQQPMRIAYREYGDPNAYPTVIALHGSPTLGDDFRKLGPLLGQRLHVIAPLLPGFGDSTPYVDDYSAAACADDVRAFMDAMHIDRAHLIGYGFGGTVAITLADQSPKRISSVTLISALGVQEHEGTGDYHFEHLKYSIGYFVCVLAPELLPHFGLLGDRSVRHAFICNFTDTDQRPVRAMLERFNDPGRDMPLLILHGRNDALIPVAAAREHHHIVEHSRLVTFPGGHTLLFHDKGAAEFAEQIVPFVEMISDSFGPPMERTTSDARRKVGVMEGKLFRRLHLDEHADPWWRMAAVAAATFFSEDLTCISVGLLVNAGLIDLFVALFGCFLGIFVCDVALWLTGRVLGRRILDWGPIARRLPSHRVEDLGQWFDRYGFVAVFASRFMPGTRIPLYVSAGVLGTRSKRFIVWALFAAMFYTPIIVLLVAVAGDVVAGPLHRFLGGGWFALLVTALLILLAIRFVTALSTPTGRFRMWAAIERFWKWEFWPRWVFYLPMLPVYLWLRLRNGGGSASAASATEDFNAIPLSPRTDDPDQHIAEVLYYRMPGEEKGHIFSVINKQLPGVTGDGKRTMEQLIWKHPRYRMQGRTLLNDLGDDRTAVLAKGERRVLDASGRHSRGTHCLDGELMKTETLERAIDELAHKIDGLHFARFELRYADADQLRAGENFKVLAVRGVRSEPSDVFAQKSVWAAYRLLARQWSLAFTLAATPRLGSRG